MAERLPSTGRRIAAALLWLACALLVLHLLGLLAARQNTAAMDASARQRLAGALAGSALATWPLTSEDDIVAGRIFGRARFAFNDDGLRIDSDGEAVEFGIHLDRQLDARRYPLIRLQVAGDPRFRYQWSAAATSDGRPCRSPPQWVQDGRLYSRIDQLEWTCPDGSTLPSLHALGYLRLVVDGPAGANTRLRDLQIGPAAALQLPDRSTTPIIRTVTDLASAVSVLSAVPVSTLPVAVVPDISGLPAGFRLQRAFPAVVVVSSLDVLDTPAAPESSRSAVTATLLLVLLAVWLRPPANDPWRAAAQLVAALLMPLWLSVGGRLGTPMHGLDGLLLAAGAVYLLLRIRDTKAWHWLGRPPAWLLPALGVLLAVGIAVLSRRDSSSTVGPEALDAIRYLAWAGLQQLILMTVVADRLSRLLWPSRWVILGTAAVFALLHSPNQPLMLLTLVGGLLWAWNWQRHRALLPNIVGHALCGLIAMYAIADWLPSAEVGSRFFGS